MGTTFYMLVGVWGVVIIAVFIQAIRLSYRIEARSPDWQTAVVCHARR
jgi:hypothetical protein